MTKQMAELLNKRKTLVASGEGFAADESKLSELNGITNEIKSLDGKIATLQAFETAQKAPDIEIAPQLELHSTNIVGAEKPKKQFNRLGEQLQCIVAAKTTHIVDKRLEMVNTIQGANESNGADGGFALQTDFVSEIFDTVISRSLILDRISVHDISNPSNSATFYTSNENDANNGVYGGLKMQWADEGETTDKSKLKLKRMKLDLAKMMGFAFITDEMLQDAAFLGSYIQEGLMLAVDDLLIDAVMNGDGIEKPLGILKSGALISVPKESGQTEKLVAQNIIKMRTRMLPKSLQNAVFSMHPDFQEILPLMKFEIGQGGVPVYLPQTGLTALPYDTLYGKPIIFDQNCSAVGKTGDIIFADWSKYMIIKKGEAKKDWSMHVEFMSDQSCFRVVFRINGAPKYEAKIKIKNSEIYRSPYITMADRV